MSGLPVIPCEGAPRDLGLDQGTACAAAIRERVRRAGGHGDFLGRWRPFARGALERARATGRDVRRHFPHLDEWLAGLARGAEVPELALHHLLARELGPEGEGAALRAGIDGEGRIVLQGPRAGVLRRIAPEAGFTSVEWTLPWLPGAFAGVNGAGLAGVAVTRGAEEAASAPAFLLLQNCLQQFETVENAVEWCERRPAGGRAALLFCDRSGGRAAVSLEDGKRTRTDPAAAGPDADGTPAIGLILDAKARKLTARSAARGEPLVVEPPQAAASEAL